MGSHKLWMEVSAVKAERKHSLTFTLVILIPVTVENTQVHLSDYKTLEYHSNALNIDIADNLFHTAETQV